MSKAGSGSRFLFSEQFFLGQSLRRVCRTAPCDPSWGAADQATHHGPGYCEARGVGFANTSDTSL